MRIQIQHFSNCEFGSSSRSRVLMPKNLLLGKNLYFFDLKKCNLLINKGRPATGEAFSPQKRTSSILKRENSFLFFYFCVSFLPSWIRIRTQKLKLMRIRNSGIIFLIFQHLSNSPGHLCRMCDVSLAVLWLGIDLMPIRIRTRLYMLMPILIRIRILLYVFRMLENQIFKIFIYCTAMPVCFIFLVKCLSVSTKSRKISICPIPKHKHLTTVIRIRQNDPVPDPQHWSVVCIMLHCHCPRLPEPAGICKLQAAVGGAHC
jgi:hypothetical protein